MNAAPTQPGTTESLRPPNQASDRASAMLAALRTLEQDHDDVAERAEALLKILATGHGALAGALTLGIGQIEAERSFEGGQPGLDAWRGELRAAALDARTHGFALGRVFGTDAAKPTLMVVTAPIETISGNIIGGVALLTRWRDEEHARMLQPQLRSTCVIASSAFHRPSPSRQSLQMDDFARVLARAGSFRTIHEYAYALTNAAKQRFGCEQASFGLVERNGIEVVCISGLDHVKTRSPGVRHIQQAMGECMDARVALIAQPKDQWSGGASIASGLLHERWRAACAGSCALSVPLVVEDRVVAVLSLLRSSDDPFALEDVEALTTLVTPLAATLPVVRKSTRSLSTHARDSLVDGYRWITKPGTRPRQVLLAFAIAFALWFMFKPTMYRVSTAASIVAGREVIVASALDATVSEVFVRSGDRVTEGTLLATLDTGPLHTQRAHLQSELEGAALRLTHAIATSDPAAASVAQAERDAHAARLERIEQQVAMAQVRAPIDGVVVSTDLEHLAGRLVPVGEALMVIADESTLHVELELPEHRVTDLQKGARVRFASHARPEDAATVELVHVDPAASVRNGRAVFLARASFPKDQAWLRPGMEGVAMVDSERHPNIWLGLRRVIDFAHLNFWIE